MSDQQRGDLLEGAEFANTAEVLKGKNKAESSTGPLDEIK